MLMPFALMMLFTLSIAAPNTAADILTQGVCSNVLASPDGSLVLAPDVSSGTCGVVLDLPRPRPEAVRIELAGPVIPDGDARCHMWPVLATDIITQVRFQSGNGRWTEWMPRNILRGGDMADSDSDGIPDWVSVMRLRESGNLIFADTAISTWMPPTGDYWEGKARDRGRFVDSVERPPGTAQSLRLTRGASDGQDTAAMRLDLVPNDTELTICGWTKYDITGASMGVMSRFHEFDSAGNRVNKYVMLGDDDFHQPSGRSEWVWRALSFRSLPQTTFLNLYPIRMITAQGRAWAADFEVCLGPVFSDWGRGRIVFQDDFESLDGWEFSGPASLSDTAAEGKASLVLRPESFKVVTATQKDYIDVEPGQLYAFRVALQNDVPKHYEPTHQAWVSACLEFFDKDRRFLDYCKVMAFRATLGKPVGAAMPAPEGARYARFMLAASHISYGDRTGMNGPMHAYFDALQLEKSVFDPRFSPRPDRGIQLDIPPNARRMEIRSFLLSREAHLRPSFKGYVLSYPAR